MKVFKKIKKLLIIKNNNVWHKLKNIKNRKNINTIIYGIYRGEKYKGNIIIFNNMPQIYKDIGVMNVALLISPNKIRTSVLTKTEAKILGYSTSKNDNYHGLGKRLFNDALDNLYNPVMIMKENKNKIIVLTEQFKKGQEIIVPIEINTISEYAKVRDLYNVTKTIYNKKGITNFLKKLINNGASIEYLDNKKHRT